MSLIYADTKRSLMRPGSDGPGGERKRAVFSVREPDVHELLKAQDFVRPKEPPASDKHFEKNRPSPYAPHGYSDQYLVLDSFMKVKSSRVDLGEFQWNLAIQGSTDDDAIGVRDRLDCAVSIQIGPFGMPILPEVPYVLAAAPVVTPTGRNQLVLVHNNNNGVSGAPTLIPTAGGFGQYPVSILAPPSTTTFPWTNNPYTQTPFRNRITVQVGQAGLQSFSDRNGARHHFELALTHADTIGVSPISMTATPALGWDEFKFTDPIKDLHGITLIFRNPDVPIRFLPDCFYGAVMSSDGAAAPGPFLMITAVAHGLQMGDRVYIDGFASGNRTLDNYVNRTDGHVAAGDPTLAPLAPSANIPTANTFWLDPAVSIIDMSSPIPKLPQTVTVRVAKRRLRIPLRVRRVIGRLTNYEVLS